MHVSYTYNAYTHSLPSSSAVTAGSSGTGVARWRQPGRWSSMTFVWSFSPGEIRNLEIEFARWFKVTFLSPGWRSLNLLKGSRFHTIPKRSRIESPGGMKKFCWLYKLEKVDPNKDRKKQEIGWLKLKECDFIVWNGNWNRNFSQGPPDIFKDLLTWVAQKLP